VPDARRFGRWIRRAVIATVAALLCLWFGWWYGKQREYDAEYDPTRKAILAMDDKPPPGLNPSCWKAAVIWSHNAYVETFMFHEVVDLDSLHRFGAGFRERQGRGQPAELLVWIWDELERASPRGERYVSRFRPAFQEHLDCARSPDGDPRRPER